MSKVIKGLVSDAIAKRLGDTRDLLVADISRLDAVAENQWRLELRSKSVQVLTVPNALAQRAFNQVGVVDLGDILQGPSTLFYGGSDIVALSKELVGAANEEEKIQIKGGCLEGSRLDADEVVALSKSPSREELIAQIVGQAIAPGANLAAALLGPGGALASQLKSVADGGEDEESPAADG